MLPIRVRKPGFAVHQQNRQRRQHFQGEITAVVHGQFILHEVCWRLFLRRGIGFNDKRKQMRSRFVKTMMKGQRHLTVSQWSLAGDGDPTRDLATIDFQANSVRRRVRVLTE